MSLGGALHNLGATTEKALPPAKLHCTSAILGMVDFVSKNKILHLRETRQYLHGLRKCENPLFLRDRNCHLPNSIYYFRQLTICGYMYA